MSGTMVLGIDPAKRKFTACLLDAGGVVAMAPRDFTASREGFDELLALLAAAVPDGACVLAAIEASATLDDNLLGLFANWRGGFTVRLLRVDAAQTARFSGARPVRGKTDRSDARRVAEFARTYAARLDAFESDAASLEAARLVNERLALARERAALRCRLLDRLTISFPELERVLPEPCGALGLAVLDAAPTAAHLARRRLATLATLRGPGGGHRLGEQRAAALLQLARTSIASATGEHDAATIRRLVARLRLLGEQIEQTESELAEFVAHSEQARGDAAGPSIARQIAVLDTMPGIALVGASAIVLRSRGLTRFSSPRALAAQLGTCPEHRQTGSSQNSSRLTSRGDRRTRTLLYLLVTAGCIADTAMHFHRWRHRRAGHTPRQSACALMNHYARLMWTLVKNDSAYDPQRALRNIQIHHPQLWEEYLKEHPQACGKVAAGERTCALT